MSDRNRKIADGIRNSALIQNPVLFEAIGIAPIAAIAVSLKTAIILAVASCLELVIIELFTCLALKKVKSYFRMPVYAALGMLINLPVFMFFAKFTPNETLNVGIFLPLLAVNSLIALHCERLSTRFPRRRAMRLCCCLSVRRVKFWAAARFIRWICICLCS